MDYSAIPLKNSNMGEKSFGQSLLSVHRIESDIEKESMTVWTPFLHRYRVLYESNNFEIQQMLNLDIVFLVINWPKRYENYIQF